jgi:hypothetical protein
VPQPHRQSSRSDYEGTGREVAQKADRGLEFTNVIRLF